VAFNPDSHRNIEAIIYGKSSTWKFAPNLASASRNSSVGSIIVRPVTRYSERIFRLENYSTRKHADVNASKWEKWDV